MTTYERQQVRDPRMAELDALLSAPKPKPVIERMQLVTVTALSAICPWCGGPRKWSLKFCSRECSHAQWQRDNRARRNLCSQVWKAKAKKGKPKLAELRRRMDGAVKAYERALELAEQTKEAK